MELNIKSLLDWTENWGVLL